MPTFLNQDFYELSKVFQWQIRLFFYTAAAKYYLFKFHSNFDFKNFRRQNSDLHWFFQRTSHFFGKTSRSFFNALDYLTGDTPKKSPIPSSIFARNSPLPLFLCKFPGSFHLLNQLPRTKVGTKRRNKITRAAAHRKMAPWFVFVERKASFTGCYLQSTKRFLSQTICQNCFNFK